MSHDEATECGAYILELWPNTKTSQADAFARNILRHPKQLVMAAITASHPYSRDGFCPFPRIYSILPPPIVQTYQPAGDVATVERNRIQAAKAWAGLSTEKQRAIIESVTEAMPPLIRNIELAFVGRDEPSRLVWPALGVQQ
jgi:hypothetical protein